MAYFCEKQVKPAVHCEDFRLVRALPYGWTSTAQLEWVEDATATVPDPTIEGGDQQISVAAFRVPGAADESSDAVADIEIPWDVHPPFILEWVANLGTPMEPFYYLEVEVGNVRIYLKNTGALGKIEVSSDGQDLGAVPSPGDFARYELSCQDDFCILMVHRSQVGVGASIRIPGGVRGTGKIRFRTGKNMRNAAIGAVRLSFY